MGPSQELCSVPGSVQRRSIQIGGTAWYTVIDCGR
jgi:hypothetical protein